jgi:hypothetical protein
MGMSGLAERTSAETSRTNPRAKKPVDDRQRSLLRLPFAILPATKRTFINPDDFGGSLEGQAVPSPLGYEHVA